MRVLIFIYIVFCLFMLMIWGYGKAKGPSEKLSSVVFFLPMLLALVLTIYSFFSASFWLQIVLGVVLWVLYMVLSVSVLKVTLDDKSGIGVISFTGFVGMFIFTGGALVKIVMTLIGKF